MERVQFPPAWRLFLATGFLGGFTTFSTFSLDVATLWQDGRLGPAATYVLASVVLSLVVLFVALSLVQTAGRS